jgi:multifunctional beta-oxidation protein
MYGVVPLREALVAPLWARLEGVPDSVPVLHGEHVVRVFAPIELGAELVTSSGHLATAVTRTGSTVTVLAELRLPSSQLLEQHEMTAYLPGVDLGGDVGGRTRLQPAEPAYLTEQLCIPTDPEQSRWYAEASGDRTAFHVSDEQARAHGFSGVIMHGLCTLTMTLNALGDRLGQVVQAAARFTSPGLPGEDILVQWGEVSPGRAVFTTRAPSQASTITHGLVDHVRRETVP